MPVVHLSLEALKERRDAAGSKLIPSSYRFVYEDRNLARRIVIFREHHGTRYFAANTPECTLAVFLKMLTERYGPESPGVNVADEIERLTNESPEKPDYSEEDIPNLPASMQGAARKKLKQYKMNLKGTEEQLAEYKRIQKVISEKDAEEAYELCRIFQAHEDEDFDFEYLESLETDNGS